MASRAFTRDDSPCDIIIRENYAILETFYGIEYGRLTPLTSEDILTCMHDPIIQAPNETLALALQPSGETSCSPRAAPKYQECITGLSLVRIGNPIEMPHVEYES